MSKDYGAGEEMMPTPRQPGASKALAVPADYRCPLCTCCGPTDTSFRVSDVAGAAICEGCDVELSHFLEQEDRERDPVLDALERTTGLSFLACRRRYYREAIRTFEARLVPNHIESEVVSEIAHTGRTREQTVAHWRQVITDYKATLLRLEESGE